MEDLNNVVDSENATDNQKDSKKEITKPTVSKKDKAVIKKPAEPKETPKAPVVATEILTAEAEAGKAVKSDDKKVRESAKKQKIKDIKDPQNEPTSQETQGKTDPDKKQKEKIKVIKKTAKKAEAKVDKLKKKVKKARKKEVKPSKIKALKEKLGKALDKLKSRLKKLKKAKK